MKITWLLCQVRYWLSADSKGGPHAPMDTLRPKHHYKVITNNLPVPINTRTGDKYACGTLASVPGSHKLGGGGGEENLVNIVCTCSVSPTHPQFQGSWKLACMNDYFPYTLGYFCGSIKLLP